MKKIIMILGVVLFSLCVFGLTVREAVDMVKKANFYDYPADSYATVGEAFDYFFSRPRWNAFVSKNNYLIVEFNGIALVEGKPSHVKIQFMVDPSSKQWQVNYLGINETDMKLSLIEDIVKNVYEEPVNSIDQQSLAIINMIYDGKFDEYPEFEIGETFDDFFVSPKWHIFTASDATTVVQFTGTAIEDDEGYEVVIQFTVDTQKGSWYVNYFEVDGKQQELSLLPGLLEYIFVAFNYN
ncbi:MAG TPA: hypothetical protein PK741_10275 [Petrotogaceae bacterium]|nr:hypothetical protein [Petrotogaceae bacterium]